MAQVMMPQVKEDDSLNNIMAGLSIYSTVSDLRTKAMQDKMNNTPKSAEQNQPTNALEAMQRRARKSSQMEMME